MYRVILVGCNGKMGKILSASIASNKNFEVVSGIDIITENNLFPVFSNLKEYQGNADVIIDFSNPKMLKSYINEAENREIPCVIATTGFEENEIKRITQASESIAIFRSANMSLGINLLQKLVKKAAETLGFGINVEIIEKHHNMKKDAPSGTALMLAKSVNSAFNNKLDYSFGRHGKNCKRSNTEVGLHAVRGGTIVGEHDVLFAGNDETITISHSASSRQVFATGAISAARFIIDKKQGLYNMQDLLEDEGENK